MTVPLPPLPFLLPLTRISFSSFIFFLLSLRAVNLNQSLPPPSSPFDWSDHIRNSSPNVTTRSHFFWMNGDVHGRISSSVCEWCLVCSQGDKPYLEAKVSEHSYCAQNNLSPCLTNTRKRYLSNTNSMPNFFTKPETAFGMRQKST